MRQARLRPGPCRTLCPCVNGAWHGSRAPVIPSGTGAAPGYRGPLLGRLPAPGLAATEHEIEDCQQLAHAGRERNLLGFSGLDQAIVKSLQHRVAA